MKYLQMKKLAASTIVAAAMFAATMPAALAATVGPTNFNVTASLSAICTAGTISNLAFGSYTAFQVGAVTPTTTLAITCSRGLAAPTYTFDAAGGGNFGVIAGLNYALGASITGTAAGTAATAALNAIGTPDVHTITITGNMPGNQAGDCAGGNATACATAVTQLRTILVTY